MTRLALQPVLKTAIEIAPPDPPPPPGETTRFLLPSIIPLDATHSLACWMRERDPGFTFVHEIQAVVIDHAITASPTIGSIFTVTSPGNIEALTVAFVPATNVVLFGTSQEFFGADYVVGATVDVSTLTITAGSTVSVNGGDAIGYPPVIVPVSATRAFVFSTSLHFIVGVGYERRIHWELWAVGATGLSGSALTTGDIADNSALSGGNTVWDAVRLTTDVAFVSAADSTGSGVYVFIRGGGDAVTVGPLKTGVHHGFGGGPAGGVRAGNQFLGVSPSFHVLLCTVNVVTGVVTTVDCGLPIITGGASLLSTSLYVSDDVWLFAAECLWCDGATAVGGAITAIRGSGFGIGDRVFSLVGARQFYGIYFGPGAPNSVFVRLYDLTAVIEVDNPTVEFHLDFFGLTTSGGAPPGLRWGSVV